MRFVSFLILGLIATSAYSAEPSTAAEIPATPTGYPGAESFVYRELAPVPIRLHVYKPKGWSKSDRRPALAYFFGGGWVKGSTDHSIGWARWAAQLGMVGIAPDYRVKDRFGTSPLEAVADARAALKWVEDHATELGIDSTKIVVAGNSAGGHLALWTAIAKPPPGSSDSESPPTKPVALLLSSPVSDTTEGKGYMPSRFGPNAAGLSAIDHLDEKMPPVLLFHGDADQVVPQRQSLALRDKLIATGNSCEFIDVPGGSHNFSTDLPEWKDKVRSAIVVFLERQHLLPKNSP